MFRFIALSYVFFITSCTSMPALFDDIEKIATDDAITVKVDKDAFQKDTDVNVTVDIKNKEAPVK